MAGPSDDEIRRLLADTRSIAVVGVSANPARPSHEVAAMLAATGAYELMFVNPTETEILGRPVYASLADLPHPPDMVDVFRRPEHLPAVAREAVRAGAKSLWMQLGLRSAEAAGIAVEAGMQVVQDRCIKIEYQRLRPHG